MRGMGKDEVVKGWQEADGGRDKQDEKEQNNIPGIENRPVELAHAARSLT